MAVELMQLQHVLKIISSHRLSHIDSIPLFRKGEVLSFTFFSILKVFVVNITKELKIFPITCKVIQYKSDNRKTINIYL